MYCNSCFYAAATELWSKTSFGVIVLASFIRVVGSEFVQKYLGEGPRMVRDVFRLAKENSPAIIFIDEIDAIATKRFDAQTGGNIYLRIQMPCESAFCDDCTCM